MKSVRILSLSVLALFLVPSALAADFGVRGGLYQDSGDNFVGAEAQFDIGAVNINPNIEYSLADEVTAGSANLDVTVDIGQFNRVTPYLGAGVGLWYLDDDFGDDTTDLLGNLIGGVSFNLDFLKPYAQVKYFRTLEDDEGGNDHDIAFTVGVRF